MVGSNSENLRHAHLLECCDVLESPLDPQRHDSRSWDSPALHPFNQDGPRGRVQKPRDAVEERGLSGAVRTDESHAFTGPHVEVHVGKGVHAAERDR